MKKVIRKKKRKKDWFKIKKYPHIGLPLSGKNRGWVEAYVRSKEKIASHRFLPFIHKVSMVRKFRREISHDGTRSTLRKPSLKSRELYYSAHLDSNIYSYYAEAIAQSYERKLAFFRISECVTAYRKIPLDATDPKSRNKCNVDFANDVFGYIKNHPSAHLVAITFDIKKFFDTLNHRRLKKMWRAVIGPTADLPPDHYAIYRNITKFSYIEERDIFNEFKDGIIVERESTAVKKKIARRKFLKGKRAISFCLETEIERLRTKNYIKSNKRKLELSGKSLRQEGIPQGSPISSILANVYMLEFDALAKAFLGKRGLYRRYSDDMVIVCAPELELDVIDFFGHYIKQINLELQASKTQVFHFTKEEGRVHFQCKEKNLNTGRFQTNTKFEYLGFQFDGFTTLLKSASLASYYRKMKRSVKRGFFYSIYNKTSSKGELFKNRLYKKFTHLGAHRRRIYERDKNYPDRFLLTQKYDWGNFLSYAYLAARVIPDNKIKRQVRRHWKKFHQLINGS